MIRRPLFSVLAVTVFAAACGGGSDTPAATPAAAAPATASAAAPKPAGTVALIEPSEGAMGGHIDMFRWSPVEGADNYLIIIKAVTGDRTVWESPVMTATETKLPTTVALEPEVHTWSVTARKAGQVIATSAIHRFTITP
ncbi:MAG: hypothetical protein FJW22_05780 [Acidimicrobiia bacterium]|nr:hypothetical protein [Acidimicrobiia bacterium]